jgi:beta-mannosidase
MKCLKCGYHNNNGIYKNETITGAKNMNHVNLNGEWQLYNEDLASGSADDAKRITELKDEWIPAPVPGDIHQGLVTLGKIKEPLVGMNSFDCVWTENQSWWYRKEFNTELGWQDADDVELELDGLDSNASVFLNGTFLGKHVSTFYPFRKKIKQHLNKTGNNVLLVRLSTGVETVTEEDIAGLGVAAGTEAANNRPERGEPRRPFVRKPQYSFGWDWSPRVATTGITGNAVIRVYNDAIIRDVYIKPIQGKGKSVLLDVTVTVDSVHLLKTCIGKTTLKIAGKSGPAIKLSKSSLLKSGLNYIKFDVMIKNPELWWPNGMGDQNLYTVDAELVTEKDKSVFPSFKYGIRFIRLDTGNKFCLMINDKKVFCKGANWIPADTVYARTTNEKYRELVRQAKGANFNMLRIWGGGLYERAAFYDACNEFGIMIWHDFMFACAPYPDHLDWFNREVEREIEYQTIRLRNNPCIAIWSGNNECNWGMETWCDKTLGGLFTYNYVIPRIIQKNCPEIPYWNGSPYGGPTPNSVISGDEHHWFECMMNPDMEKRITPEEYDKCTSLFVSEYGYIGAPVKQTIIDYYGNTAIDRNSNVWQHHNNTFEKNTVNAGIKKHYTNPENLSLDEYLLYSGLCQGMMYGYSIESLRSRLNCSGAMFWMYEDCWGEIGWTIIDYYLRRKISWYFVKRACSPARIILKNNNGVISVTIANDTSKPVRGILEYGTVSRDGKTRVVKEKKISCPAFTTQPVVTFKPNKTAGHETIRYARIKNRPDILTGMVRVENRLGLNIGNPAISWELTKLSKTKWNIRVESPVFVHAVHFDLPGMALPEDNYFDLLPGESRDVIVTSDTDLDSRSVKVSCVN